MKRSFFARGAHQATLAQAELSRLWTLLDPSGAPSTPKPSVASIAMLTMHTPSGATTGIPHSVNCPVYRKLTPLVSISSEQAFVAKPCPLCLRQRANFLASELFCTDFERRCFVVAKASGSSIPHELDNAIQAQFSTFASFQEEFILFAANGMSPGRTWLVYRVNGGVAKLSFVNLPSSQLPLAFGLWPVAVVNMTEEVLCKALTELAEPVEDGGADHPPVWSRAARNHAAMVPPVSPPGAGGRSANMDMATVRLYAVRTAFAAMNWDFVDEQLRQAKVYFGSQDRVQLRQARRQRLEDVVTKSALGSVRGSEAIVITTRIMDQEQAAKPGKQAEQPSRKGEETTTADAASARPSSSDDQASTGAAPLTTPLPSKSEEPAKTRLDDGTWEYRYANGDVTLLHQDGTQVFHTESVTTTVYTNGNTLFEYKNKSKILDRADGVRITTYADGTTVEEVIADAR